MRELKISERSMMFLILAVCLATGKDRQEVAAEASDLGATSDYKDMRDALESMYLATTNL